MSDPTTKPVWATLRARAEQMHGVHLQTLFAAGDARVQRLSVEAAGLYLDCSKQRVTPEIMRILEDLAKQQGLPERREALFTGQVVNSTENRAAWHTALRAPVGGNTGCDDVRAVLDEMRAFVGAVHSGEWRGGDGEIITDVVNLGIGGSDLGPRLVCEALAVPADTPQTHYVANVDPNDLGDVLSRLEPATTLFIVTSKSFTSAETMANARAARKWLHEAGITGAGLARHMIAVSANREAVEAFGIQRMFEFWDWVGGRYSLWSAVGLPIALALGMDAFETLLVGAHAMDRHFLEAPLEANLPVMLALIGVWNRNFLGLTGHVAVPYAQRLKYFAEWLQQLEMESNGKGATYAGDAVKCATVPMIWGTVGTNAQHAYFQMLHQAALAADVDFILPLPDGDMADDGRERQRVANCLAQAEALMSGQSPAAADPADEQQALMAAARYCEGNRPSSTLLMPRLDAWHLGALLAAYEHKTFVQGVIWDVNSFDQCGVELGKSLAGRLIQELESDGQTATHDASTRTLLERVRSSLS